MIPTVGLAANVCATALRSVDEPGQRTGELSRQAKQRLRESWGEPFLFSDWRRTLFIHLEVDPVALQPEVPFELDLLAGKAYVSLVAFSLEKMRPVLGGRATAALMSPLASHGLLNIRTYVQHRGEAGIYFLSEYLPNWVSAALGPWLYGLPYRLGRLNYRHDYERGSIAGEVCRGDRRLRYEGHLPAGSEYVPCLANTPDEFLLERYTAFTHFHGIKRRFRIWHEPWPVQRLKVDVTDASLLAATGEWSKRAQIIGAHFSPGVEQVWMGRPCLA